MRCRRGRVVLTAAIAFAACGGGQSKDAAFLSDLAHQYSMRGVDYHEVSDARLVAAGQQVCAALNNIAHPTFTANLSAIVEQQITPTMTGAHNPGGANGNDNGPTVLAYGVAQAAVDKFCSDKTSALND